MSTFMEICLKIIRSNNEDVAPESIFSVTMWIVVHVTSKIEKERKTSPVSLWIVLIVGHMYRGWCRRIVNINYKKLNDTSSNEHKYLKIKWRTTSTLSTGE